MNSIVSVYDLHPGDSLLWYRLERILRHDSSGVIYVATDTKLDRYVTIKEYIPSNIAKRSDDGKVLPISKVHSDMYRSGLDHFINEGKTLARFNHPNIVRVESVFEENNTAYIVTELEAGLKLHTYLSRTEGVSEAELKSLILPVAEGLAEAHRRGFIHRDINPWNILVRSNGAPLLLDFGSRRITRKLTLQDSTLPNFDCYAALEQFNPGPSAKQGPWTDIYSLGGVLYFAISGNDPIDSNSRNETMSQGGRDPFVPASVIGKGMYSESFLNAVDWALQLRIADRPSSLQVWNKAGLYGEGLSDAFPGEWTGILDEPFEPSASTRYSSSRRDADATGRPYDITFGDSYSTSEWSAPKASQRQKSRVIGFPTISIVIILTLIVTIVIAIATSK